MLRPLPDIKTLYLATRLKAEVEKKDVEYEESLAVLQSRHSTEVKDLQAQLQEAETTRQQMHQEVCHPDIRANQTKSIGEAERRKQI